MLALLKYEMLKKWNVFLLALAGIGLCEGFIIYELTVKHNWGLSAGLFGLLGGAGALFVLIDSILSFYNELNRKTCYMLFLTPRNSYQILGIKSIISLLELIVGGLIYLLLSTLNYGLVKDIYTGNEIFNYFDVLIDTKIDIIISAFINSISMWFFTILISFFAITLTFTVLLNNKFSGFISAILAVVLQVSIIRVIVLFSKKVISTNSGYLITSLFLAVSIVFYFISSYLLEKKLSL